MQKQVIEARKPKTNLPVISPIHERFSPRVFSQIEIPNEHIEIVLEAARLAPSARNLQPWKFFLIKRTNDVYNKLEGSIPERNLWCRQASLFIIATYDPTEPNDGKNKWCQYDLGAACMSLILQAQELGYYSRQIGSFDAEKLKVDLKIEDPYIPFVIIAMGKMGTEEDYKAAQNEIVNKDLMQWDRKDSIYEEISE